MNYSVRNLSDIVYDQQGTAYEKFTNKRLKHDFVQFVSNAIKIRGNYIVHGVLLLSQD